MIRGYSGFYNNIYLRSSFEFAFAYYLDYKKIIWKYEVCTYELKTSKYKPDFFIYNNKGELVKIIEIKSKENRLEGLRKIEEFKKIYNIPIELVDYEILLKIYKEEMPISLNKTKKIFIEEYGAKLEEQNMKGNLNPMFGVKQSEKTKKVIGVKCRERFSDETFKEKFKNSLKNRTYKSGYEKVEREVRCCLKCGKKFKVTSNSKRKFCSKTCAGKTTVMEAQEKKKFNYNEKKEDIKNFIIKWAIENKEIVIDCPYNKISSILNPLYILLKDKYNITDKRTISNLFDTNSRKQFLKILKNYLISKNIC